MLHHIRVLASDEFEGRAPGTRGEQLTVDYLVGEFKRLGLKPGNPDGTYVQRVLFVGSRAKSELTFNVAGQRIVLKEPDDFYGFARWQRVELEANYQRLRVLEQQQAVVAERARIMSDMHDGIGGQLISALSLVEHGEASKEQVAASLRECIDDLRLTIDSLEPTDDDLLPVLGNLRYRLEGRLERQGIALDWQVGDVPRLACLTPQNVLHILRILQEAFTNVLKHAQASLIRVETHVDAGRVSIRVSDNGKGFDGNASVQGHGLANMRGRARTIGGDLEITPSASGTTLALLLPIG